MEGGESTPIVVKVAAEMMMVRFDEMMEDFQAAQERGETERPLTYLKVKAALVAEFGSEAFQLKKAVINKKMRTEQASAQDRTSRPSIAGTESNRSSPTNDQPTRAASHSSWVTEAPVEDPTPKMGAAGEVLNVKVTRPNSQSLGFKVIGGVDRGYGGTFVSSVTSSSAADLKVGDRIISVNGMGLLGTTQAESERILSRVQRTLVVTVLRPSHNDWQCLFEKFGPKPPSTYTKTCRRIATAPLVKLSTIMYLGTSHLKGECSSFSGGEIYSCVLNKTSREKLVGIRMAGSFELGGIFITAVQEESLAAGDDRIQPGCRVLEVSGRSLLYATQIDASRLIRQCSSQVALVLQEVPAAQWREIQARVAADVASTLVTKANAIREKKDPENPTHRQAITTARKLYKEALTHNNLDPALKCQALSGLGRTCTRAEWGDAVQYHKDEALLCTELGYAEVAARALNFVGNAYRVGNQLTRAIEAYEKELQVVECAKDNTGLSRAWSSLGIAHGGKGNLQRAVECHSKALTAANAGQDRVAAARAHSNLGISYFQLKEYDQALKHHTARLKVAEGLGDIAGQCKALNNLKEVAVAQGKKDAALEYWKQLESLMKQLPPDARMSSSSQRAPSTTPAAARRNSTIHNEQRPAQPVIVKMDAKTDHEGDVANASESDGSVVAKSPEGHAVVSTANPTAAEKSTANKPSSWADLIPENVVAADLVPEAVSEEKSSSTKPRESSSWAALIPDNIVAADLNPTSNNAASKDTSTPSTWADLIPENVAAADLAPESTNGNEGDSDVDSDVASSPNPGGVSRKQDETVDMGRKSESTLQMDTEPFSESQEQNLNDGLHLRSPASPSRKTSIAEDEQNIISPLPIVSAYPVPAAMSLEDFM